MIITAIYVLTLYIDSSTLVQNGKKYTRHLLRESFRENGKVKHRTIASLSRCSPEEIEAIRLALRHKKDLSQVTVFSKDSISLRQGLSVGAVWLVYDIARQLGIAEALGMSPSGKLALWQVMARVIDQGSRLSAVRLVSRHGACDILGLNQFNEEDLYQNLDWLCEKQSLVEDRLFKKLHGDEKPGLFLYDVTSSYLEGEQNELSAFGYNRDGKKGKRQIVIGLLCDEEGRPLSIEVFVGNTQDTKTFGSQVKKVANRFGGGEVTFVGDRGMIKGPQIEDLQSYAKHQFHYITAITKPQIEKLLEKEIFQMDLFDEKLSEVISENVRYVLKRNPQRAREIQKSREEKYQSLLKEVQKQNIHLAAHSRAKGTVAFRKIQAKSKTLKISEWVQVTIQGREILIHQDKEALVIEARLDGCYALKTDLMDPKISKETIHDRYKDLAQVEWAFRSSKTAQLEMRPIYVRKESRTRGHALVVMLAYRIIQELAKRWHHLNVTVEEGIKETGTLCMTKVTIKGGTSYHQIPEPSESVQKLLKSAQVILPKVLPNRGIIVSTKRKLQERRNLNKS